MTLEIYFVIDNGDRRERGPAARALPAQLREATQLQVRHRRGRLRRFLLEHVSYLTIRLTSYSLFYSNAKLATPDVN